MKIKKLLVKTIYLLIMSSFLFDSYYKFNQLPKEADKLRSKYQNMQEMLNRYGLEFPIQSTDVSHNSQEIIQAYAGIQAITAILVLIGKRQFSWILIILTFIQTFVMYNPYYRNTTEIDKQRCFKHIYTDMCLVATLIIVTGFKKVPQLKVKIN